MRRSWQLGEILEQVRLTVGARIAGVYRISDDIIRQALQATLGELALIAGAEDPTWWREAEVYAIPDDVLQVIEFPQLGGDDRLYALPLPSRAFDVVLVALERDGRWEPCSRVSLSELVSAVAASWTARRVYALWGTVEDERKLDTVYHVRRRVIWVWGREGGRVRAEYRAVPEIPLRIDGSTLQMPIEVEQKYEEWVILATALKVLYVLGAREQELVSLTQDTLRSLAAAMSAGERRQARGDVAELVSRLRSALRNADR